MVDPATFRAVLGRLASGVSIVTVVGRDGRDHGMTVTALSSLSLDPPLLLVCIDHEATAYTHMAEASHFGVNLLTDEQESLSRRFAESRDDRFDGVGYTRHTTGVALLDDALAHIECSMWERFEGGDHTIFVGKVDRAVARDGRPLLYYRGGYASLER